MSCSAVEAVRSSPGAACSAPACAAQTFLFLNQKAKSLFHDRKRPAKIAWTAQFRKAHKKVGSPSTAAQPLVHSLTQTHAVDLCLGTTCQSMQ